MASGRNPFSHLSCAALSDIGRKRQNNEDSAASFPSRGVWCVADGMGGGDDGEIASRAVVRAVDACLADLPSPEEGEFQALDVANAIVRAIEGASAWIYDRAVQKRLNGCGSTVVGVVFDATCPGTAVAFHAGDSRLYRLRGRDITQITRDHSVEELMGGKDGDRLNPMFRGMILRAVGVERTVDVELTKFSVRAGDVVIVCSDGLSRMVPDKLIGDLVRDAEGDMAVAVTELVRAANEAGGIDNITVSLVHVGNLPSPCATAAFPEDEDSSSTGTTGSTGLAPTEFKGDRWFDSLTRLPWKIVLAVLVACGVILFVVLIAVTASNDSKGPPPPAAATLAPTTTPPVAVSAPAAAEQTTSPSADAAPPVSIKPEPQVAAPVKEDRELLTRLRRVEQATVNDEERRDEDERQKALAMLKAQRESRVAEETKATAQDNLRRETARRLADYYYRDEFVSFAVLADHVLGKNASQRLRSLGQTLHHHKNKEDIFDAATEFTAEALSLATRLNTSGWPRAAGGTKASGRVDPRLAKAYRAFSSADPSTEESQRALISLFDVLANEAEEENGRLR